MNNIKWEDGAVCFAAKKQWNSILQHEVIIDLADFQLNEIRTGDCIPASELDTEQKYNDAVEVFELFGFDPLYDYEEFTADSESHYNTVIADDEYKIDLCDASFGGCKRKITFSQLMAIGKLKRAMLERDSELEYSNRVIDSGCYDLNSKSKVDGNKYHRTIYGLCGTPAKVDVYRVSDAFPTGSASIDHAVKKILCAGLRGHKDKLTDIDNAIESLQAARLLLIQKGEV